MKPSILIAATHPTQCTGYSRVGCTLANGLAERGWRVFYWAYQNLAPESQRRVHPEVEVLDVATIVGEPLSFGEHELPDHIQSIRPDIVLLYNDVMVLNRFLDRIRKFVTDHRFPVHRPKIVSYLDLVHDNEHAGMVRGVVDRSDRVWVFAEHWKRHAFAPDDPVDVVPHGIDPSLIEVADSVTQAEARRVLGLPIEGFLVVNTNRNSYRKALDLSIEGFLRFWKDRCDDAPAYLVLNNNAGVEGGYDIPAIVHACCVRLGIEDIDRVMTSVVLGFQNGGFVTDRNMAYLYKAASAGLNSCLGEGFGLCQLEGACIGVPQVATATGGLIDMLHGDNNGHVLVNTAIHLTLPRAFVDHSGTLDVPDPRDIAKALSRVRDTGDVLDSTAMRSRYDWVPILDRAHEVLHALKQQGTL